MIFCLSNANVLRRTGRDGKEGRRFATARPGAVPGPIEPARELFRALVLLRFQSPDRVRGAKVVPAFAGNAPVKTPEIRGIHGQDGGTITAAAKRSQMNDICISTQRD
jgi:hypothetical protein